MEKRESGVALTIWFGRDWLSAGFLREGKLGMRFFLGAVIITVGIWTCGGNEGIIGARFVVLRCRWSD